MEKNINEATNKLDDFKHNISVEDDQLIFCLYIIYNKLCKYIVSKT